MLLYDDSTIEVPIYCAPAWYQACLFYYQQFLRLGLESVEHDLAGMADQADGTIVLTLLEVAFLW